MFEKTDEGTVFFSLQ